MLAAQPEDGTDAAAYHCLNAARPADLAWEWLRRDPHYRPSAHASVTTAGAVTVLDPAPTDCIARWGCLNMPDARTTWTDAPLLWSRDVDPSVLDVLALPVTDRLGPPFDLATCGAMATVINAVDRQHVLLRDHAGSVRLDLHSGSLLDGPVSLVFSLAGMESSEPALRQFLHLQRTGRFPARSSQACQHLRRQVRALRVHDALVGGASIREIGILLFGVDRVRDEWADEALKSQCRRLISLARDMAAGGYLTLLR